jgi:hypothetical protein
VVGDALSIANARWDEALDAAEASGAPRTVREFVEIRVPRGLPPTGLEGDETSARFLAMLLKTRRELVMETAKRGSRGALDQR